MLQQISLPEKAQFVKGNSFEAVFKIEGCYPGYGNTLGNALRRVLLSSLSGFAITRVKIKGISHEFSILPGVKENMVQLILNLKKVRFMMQGDVPTKIKLKASGEQEVKAGDFVIPSNIKVINEDFVIANLTDSKAKLELEATVEQGIGYSAIESREEREDRQVGEIEVDTLFSPVKKINYEVENMRVGKRTDFERLIFLIETDGSITPEVAFKEGVMILIKQFSVLFNIKEQIILEEITKEIDSRELKNITQENEEIEKEEGKDKNERKRKKRLKIKEEIKLEDLNLNKRVMLILQENHLTTLEKITEKTEEELKSLDGLGEKGVKDIKKAVGVYGIVLND